MCGGKQRPGSLVAAPIVSLMVEKYLKDSITGKARLELEETMANTNLIPPRIYEALRKQDSMRHAKDSAYLMAKGFIKSINDTMDIDEGDQEDALDKLKGDTEELKTGKNKKDSNDNKIRIKTEAILPDKQKKPKLKDSAGT